MPKSTAMTAAERQAARTERMKAAGFKLLRNLWAKPDDEERIRAYVARLNRRK